jgi:hypothetical protein
MKTFASHSRILAIASSIVLLSACGGGGGGGSDGDSSAGGGPTTPASTITSANAPNVAAQSVAASEAVTGEIDGAVFSITTGVTVETSAGPSLLNSTLGQLYRALKVKPANMVVGVTGTETFDCTGGGTMKAMYKVVTTDELSNGDQLTLTAIDCIEEQTKMNGSLSFSFSNVNGTPDAASAWGATMAIGFNNFSATTANVTETASGDLTLTYNQTTPNNASYSASGNSLQLSTTKAGTTVTRTISSLSESGAIVSGLLTHRSAFTFDGKLPGVGSGTYTVKTLTDFKQQDGANPSQGVLTVSASDQSSLKLTVLDTSNVQIEIDKNGDGKMDETSTKTWTELRSLL